MLVMFYIASLPEDELKYRQFPLGTGYIGAYIKLHCKDVRVLITAEEKDILREKPDILGISAVTQCINKATQVAKRVKLQLNIPIILGGYHISSLPHRLSKHVDVGVIGEGENSTLNVIRLLRKKKRLDANDLAKIEGICYHDDAGQIQITPTAAPTKMIDTLPFPMRNISPGARNIQIFTSRGCPYRCKYCASTRHWENFRAHSPEYVIRELQYLIRKYNATSIHILDDLFFANRKRFFTICELLEKADLVGTLRFHAFITSNLAKRDVLQAAKTIGFRSIRFGAETGSERLLKAMKGNWASVAHHQNCIDLCRDLDLEVRAAFMFGTPGETDEDIHATYQFIEKNKDILKIDGLYFTTPLPGTPYWRLAKQKGLVNDDMDWDRLNVDIRKQRSFNFKNAVYLNEENMPLKTLIEHIKTFENDFCFHSMGHQPKQQSSQEIASIT